MRRAIAGGDGAEQIGERPGPGLGDQLGGGAVGDDFSAVNNDGAGTGGFHLFQNVGGEKDGLGFTEAFDQLPDLVFLVRVETVGRFVEDENLGIVEE